MKEHTWNTNAYLEVLAAKLGRKLQVRGCLLATAESCTGGWVSQVVTSIAGSSQWFDRGFVTYSNQAKQEMLAVRPETLARFGAVSEQTACEMAEGALKHSLAQLSLAITGIAGPDGGTPEKPVGTVWFAWAGLDFATITQQQLFIGNRMEVRVASVEFALKKLIEKLN